MFGLFGSGPEVSLQTDSGQLGPGQELRGSVTIRCTEEHDVRSGTVALQCEAEIEARVRQRGQRGSRVVKRRGRDNVYEQEQTLLEGSVLPAGQLSTYGFVFLLPNPALPTYEGEILKLRWKLRTKLDIKSAFDASAEQEMVVCLPPAGPYTPDPDANEPTYDECDLTLSLGGTAVRTGGTLTGAVHVIAKQALELHEVRVHLSRREQVTVGEGNEHSVEAARLPIAPASTLAAGDQRDYPFSIELPAGRTPSVWTPVGGAYWELDVVLARRLAPDLHLKRRINVYTEPSEVG